MTRLDPRARTLQLLDSKACASAGQFVLVVERTEFPTTSHPERPGDYGLAKTVSLGLLTEGGLRFLSPNQDEWALPTNSYACWRSRWPDAIETKPDKYLSLQEPVSSIYYGTDQEPWQNHDHRRTLFAEIHVGNEAVDAWFNGKSLRKNIALRLMRALNLPLDHLPLMRGYLEDQKQKTLERIVKQLRNRDEAVRAIQDGRDGGDTTLLRHAQIARGAQKALRTDLTRALELDLKEMPLVRALKQDLERT